MKKTLSTAVLAASLLMGACEQKPSTDISSVAEELRKQPYVANVRVCETEGATRNIWMFRQQHYVSQRLLNQAFEILDKGVIEGYKSANIIQEDIFKGISYLASKGISDVFSEGIHATSMDYNPLKLVPGTPGKFRYNTRPQETYTPEYLYNTTIAEMRRDAHVDEKMFPYLPGSALVAGMKGIVNIHPAATQESVNKGVRNPTVEYLYDDREDLAIRLIDHVQKRDSILVYGAAHAFAGFESCGSPNPEVTESFKDNIYEFNKNTRTDKFNFIEITPTNLQREYH
ncbi:hypothetical protein GOV11_01800 [Candidatus Woesearchaeota archaeon]|nr:hypothetical protein [Candidatus Woesearchaeota archaeon]